MKLAAGGGRAGGCAGGRAPSVPEGEDTRAAAFPSAPAWAVALARLVLLLVTTSMVTLALVGLSPIDPVQMNLGRASYARMDATQRAELAAWWGADRPIWQRYLSWAGAALTGDLGQSLRFNAPVAQVVGERALNSFVLMLVAWALSGVLGLALGVLAGARHGRLADRLVRGWCYLLSSTPTFWLALVALMVFSVWLGWFPLGFSVPIGVDAARVGWAEKLRHLVLPALVLSFVVAALAGIEEELLRRYLCSRVSAMVANCVKTVPLTQTVGQRLLFDAAPCRSRWPSRRLSRAPTCSASPCPALTNAASSTRRSARA